MASPSWSPRTLLIGAAAACAALTVPASAALAHDGGRGHGPGHAAPSRHVLLLSVDGLHESDLETYVRSHPGSALAGLVADGTSFTRAQTPVPSDSFPGLIAQVTGGTPRTTGIYYDDTFNRDLLPAGTTDCAHATPGAEVSYTEDLDKDPKALDAGQGVAGLPDGILGMTGDPRSLIDPAKLPVDPSTCKPVYPHSYLKVNTIFEVARAAGLRTAWSDKHPAYEILNGPSGGGVQDLFTPEINSDAPTPGSPNDWTTDNALTQRYDGYKVRAVLNEIDGLDHSGTTRVGTPAIFGMNFQEVSTAQKLPVSGGQRGGYLADGVTPGPVLQSALDAVDRQVGAMQAELRKTHQDRTTTIVLSAKHGQSPTAPADLTRIPDGPIVDGLNAAWKAAHPAAPAPLVRFSVDDDALILWLSDRTPAATSFARSWLLGHSGTGNGVDGSPKAYTASGLRSVASGADAARLFGVPPTDGRVPDLYGVVQHGVVYTGGTKKIAEHGGADPEDRAVPLVVSGGLAGGRRVVGRPVGTTQIAPTILSLLGLRPDALQAVRAEHTPVLPLGGDEGRR